MEYGVLHSFDEAAAMAAQWNELLRRNGARDVPFLRFEYLQAWQQHWGGGEWPGGQVCLVTGSEDGQLRGIAPLFLGANAHGQPSLLLLGSIEISDYLDLIVPAEHLAVFVEGLFTWLAGAQAPVWETLELYNLLEDSPSLAALSAACAARGWSYAVETLQPCPVIRLPGDWETYLSGIDKKQRHEIRRKMRRAAEDSAAVAWYIVQDAAALESETEDFLRLMSNDPEKARFLTPAMRRQMHAICQAAFAHGWLQLAFLTVNGVKAAAYLNFDYQERIWVYNSGLNFDLSSYSPGWVLLGHLLQWANQNQRHSFDFMRGDEDYKYRFGGLARQVVKVTISRTALS